MRTTDIRELEAARLHKELVDQERALLNLRFRKATLQLPDSNEIRKTRITISRIKTVLREREIVGALKKQADG